MFCFKPDGGSRVIFTEFCKTETGNEDEGILVSQSLKSLCLVSSIDSTILSNSDIQETAKWQFIKRTQPPLVRLSSIIFAALLPCPRPSEIQSLFFNIFISSANLKKSDTGSEPVLKTKISGVEMFESLKDFARLNTGGSTNCLPRCSMMKFWIATVILSGLRDLRTTIFQKEFSLWFHSSGNGSDSGFSDSYIFQNFYELLQKKASNPLNPDRISSILYTCLYVSAQSRSGNQFVGFYLIVISPDGPARKNLISS